MAKQKMKWVVVVNHSARNNTGIWLGEVPEKTDFSRFFQNPQEHLELQNAYNCVYFTQSCGGFGGLLNTGPNKNCRISKPIPKMILKNIDAVAEPTEEAVKEWEKCHWG